MPSVRAQHKFAEKVETFSRSVACIPFSPLHAFFYPAADLYLSCNNRTVPGALLMRERALGGKLAISFRQQYNVSFRKYILSFFRLATLPRSHTRQRTCRHKPQANRPRYSQGNTTDGPVPRLRYSS